MEQNFCLTLKHVLVEIDVLSDHAHTSSIDNFANSMCECVYCALERPSSFSPWSLKGKHSVRNKILDPILLEYFAIKDFNI